MIHCDQVLALLKTQIGRDDEVEDIRLTAEEVAGRWVDPASGGEESVNGLIYGLVQSGKTGVLSVTGAMGADRGYRTLIILTSDINPLYDQTLSRIRESFSGMDVLSKPDIRDSASFGARLRGSTCAIVATKNGRTLDALIHSLREARVRGLSCLIIDDEADQASLNTRAARDDGSTSKINEKIDTLRSFFHKNTYLQVTATPQALFLQTPDHPFRPQFTVLSHPGAAYVGGDDFFGEDSQLVREFDIRDIDSLVTGGQPQPSLNMPRSLLAALDTFIVGATFKRRHDPQANCAFLCHVSTRTADHKFIELLLRKYKQELIDGIRDSRDSVYERLEASYCQLCETHPQLRETSLDDIIDAVKFFMPSASVKLVNGQTDEDVAVLSPYNLFVGGNKLGRGVTIKNLLVSYYGRNPRRPQADTVLQHARMYGYRRDDLGLLRLFLPRQLHTVFRAIHCMETGLRELLSQQTDEEFKGLFLDDRLNPTRRNVLAPGSVGTYTGGSSYNPSQVLRDVSVRDATSQIDELVADIPNQSFATVPVSKAIELIGLVRPDPQKAQHVWDVDAIAGSLRQYAVLAKSEDVYVYIARDRGLREDRRETQGILDGGEATRVPTDKPTLFLLRIGERGQEQACWWPQVRFPSGRYAFAFAI